MNGNVVRDYWMQLYSNLLNRCPVDTRNMVSHIQMTETPETYEIIVAAPYATNPKSKTTMDKSGFTDYAYYVNNRQPHLNWVEREMKRTERIMNGRSKYLSR